MNLFALPLEPGEIAQSMDKAAHLKELGLENPGRVYWDPPTPPLHEAPICRYEGVLSHLRLLEVKAAGFRLAA